MAVLADSLAAHIEANDLLPQEQCVLRKGSSDCVDCLAADKIVITDARFKGLSGLDRFRESLRPSSHEWVTSVLDIVGMTAFTHTRSKRTAWVMQATRTVVNVVRVTKLSGTSLASAAPMGSTSTWSSTTVLC